MRKMIKVIGEAPVATTGAILCNKKLNSKLYTRRNFIQTELLIIDSENKL